LLNHDADRQFGVVVPGSAKIDSDRRGRAVLKFSRSAFGEEILQDVVDGIRVKVSMRFDIDELRFEKSENDKDYFRATKWTPIHIAIVADPADHFVGVERSKGSEDKNIQSTIINTGRSKMDPEKEKELREKLEAEAKQKIEAERAKMNDEHERSRKDSETRTADMLAFAKEYRSLLPGVDVLDEAQKFIADPAKTPADLSRHLLKMTKEKTALRTATGDVDLSEKELKEYSLSKIVRALAQNNYDELGLEKEVSQDIAERSKKSPEGIFVSTKLLFRKLQASRAQVVGTPAAGGNTVNEQITEISYIEYLEQNLLASRFGAKILAGLVGDVPMIRELTGNTFYWLEEQGAPDESNLTWSRETLTPVTCGALNKISRKMLLQSSYVSDAYLGDKIMKAVRKGIDHVYFYGTGVGQPLGLKNLTGTYGIAGAGYTRDKAIDMMTHIASEDAEIGDLKWVTNSLTKGVLMGKKIDEGSGLFLTNDSSLMLGKEVIDGSLITAGDLFHGVGSASGIAEWGVIDLDVNDKGAGWAAGEVMVRALADVNVYFEHPECYSIATGVN
jgi:HK97 family phage major capsid protein